MLCCYVAGRVNQRAAVLERFQAAIESNPDCRHVDLRRFLKGMALGFAVVVADREERDKAQREADEKHDTGADAVPQ